MQKKTKQTLIYIYNTQKHIPTKNIVIIPQKWNKIETHLFNI